jgi:hypothetical protein
MKKYWYVLATVVTRQLAVTSEISHVYMVLMHDTYEYTVSEVDITIGII